MWEILEAIENSGFATFVRETPSVLGYSTVLAFHTFGMAFLVGLSGVIALRVLGVVRGLTLAPLEAFFPLIVAGFWVNAATGLVLTSLAARSLMANPDFYIKLIAIVAAILCLRRMKQYAFSDAAAGDRASAQNPGKLWAGAMLACWAVAVLAGRLTAYTDSVRRQSAVAVVIAVVFLVAARVVVLRVARSFGTRETTGNEPAPHPRVTPSTS